MRSRSFLSPFAAPSTNTSTSAGGAGGRVSEEFAASSMDLTAIADQNMELLSQFIDTRVCIVSSFLFGFLCFAFSWSLNALTLIVFSNFSLFCSTTTTVELQPEAVALRGDEGCTQVCRIHHFWFFGLSRPSIGRLRIPIISTGTEQ
jgi:hypothetical protein